MSDELKELRRELKSLLKKEGVNVSIKGQRGTGWGWTDIAHPKGKDQWSDRELKVLQDEAGITVGHKSSWGLVDYPRLPVAVGRLKTKKFRQGKNYKNFVEEFLDVARKQQDTGTCCGGAGTIIKKNGMPIDFIRERGMSDSRTAVAEKIMQDRAKKLGLQLSHESGWVD